MAKSCLRNVLEGEIDIGTLLPALAFKAAKKKNACMPLESDRGCRKLEIVSKFLLLPTVPAPSSDCISCCPLVSAWHTSVGTTYHLCSLHLSLSLPPVPDLYFPCSFVDSSSVTSFSCHHPGKPPVFSDVWKKQQPFNSLKCL